MFKLPSWEKIEEFNLDYIADAYASEGGGNEQAEREAQDELFGKWHAGVEAAAQELFAQHGLALRPRVPQRGRLPYEYRVVPLKSWEDAAEAILDTINGVGYFHFNSLREFLDSGPYTPRQAVFSHIGYIKDRPLVYGGDSAKSYYDREWR